MWTIIVALLFGLTSGLALLFILEMGLLGTIIWGLILAAASYGIITWRLRKALTARMNQIQEIMLEGQKELQHEVTQLQTRPTGNPKQSMARLEKRQKDFIRKALEGSRSLDPFIPWVPLMSRQIATMRMQLHYQLKEFNKVDELLPKCLLLDSNSMAMKLARMYSKDEDLGVIRKTFDRSVARLKYGQSVLLYSLMAWILVQKRQEDEAHNLLVEACKNNENDTLKRNLDKLANNRARDFSNAGLAEEWYALLLEQPRISTRRVMPRADGRPF